MSLWPKAQLTRCPKNLLLYGRRVSVPSVLRKAQGSHGTEPLLALDQVNPGGELASVPTQAGTPLLLRPSNAPLLQSERWLWEGVSGTSPGVWCAQMPHTDHTALGEHSLQCPGARLDGTGCTLWTGKQLRDSAPAVTSSSTEDGEEPEAAPLLRSGTPIASPAQTLPWARRVHGCPGRPAACGSAPRAKIRASEAHGTHHRLSPRSF